MKPYVSKFSSLPQHKSTKHTYISNLRQTFSSVLFATSVSLKLPINGNYDVSTGAAAVGNKAHLRMK